MPEKGGGYVVFTSEEWNELMKYYGSRRSLRASILASVGDLVSEVGIKKTEPKPWPKCECGADLYIPGNCEKCGKSDYIEFEAGPVCRFCGRDAKPTRERCGPCTVKAGVA